MKTYIKTYMAVIGCATALATCPAFGQVGGSVTVGVPGANLTVSGGTVVPDDYVYYPAYGLYYSNHRHMWGHLDGSKFVWAGAPVGAPVDVVQGSPHIKMDWHDAPEAHHRDVVKQYPKDWRPDKR